MWKWWAILTVLVAMAMGAALPYGVAWVEVAVERVARAEKPLPEAGPLVPTR